MENNNEKKLKDPQTVRALVINEVIEKFLAENRAELVRRTQVRLEEIAAKVAADNE